MQLKFDKEFLLVFDLCERFYWSVEMDGNLIEEWVRIPIEI